jgi:hypothetical protein
MDERTPESGVEFRAVAQYDLVKNNTFNLFVECERYMRECLFDAQKERDLKFEDKFIGSLLTLYFDIMGKTDYIKELTHKDPYNKVYHLDDMIFFLRNPNQFKFKNALEYFILLRSFLEKQGFLFVETPRYSPEEMILRGLEKRQ